jgi:hypothetical protein
MSPYPPNESEQREALRRDPSEPGRHRIARSSGEPDPVIRIDPHPGWSLVPLTAIGLLVAAHIFDYVTFLEMTARHGLAAEYNPIVVMLSEQLGLPGLTLAKAASVVLLASVFMVIRPHRPRWAIGVIVIGILAGLVGGVSNIASM